MYQLGFTGSEYVVTESQLAALRELLRELEPFELHHGDCVVGDAEAHKIAQELGMGVWLHPPVDQSRRAFCRGAVGAYPPKAFLDRNKIIVRVTGTLVAAPMEMTEIVRSGVWSTVRFARKMRRKVILVLPDGTTRRE